MYPALRFGDQLEGFDGELSGSSREWSLFDLANQRLYVAMRSVGVLMADSLAVVVHISWLLDHATGKPHGNLAAADTAS